MNDRTQMKIDLLFMQTLVIKKFPINVRIFLPTIQRKLAAKCITAKKEAVVIF